MEKLIINDTGESDPREKLDQVQECGFSIVTTKNATPEWNAAVKAILRRDIESVKVLLANGYPGSPKDNENVIEVSLIGVAAYAGLAMFETVYAASPEALERARFDRWNPLSIAITKNDRRVLSRLLELVEDPLRASKYSRRVIIRSKIPEIVQFIRANYRREDLEEADAETHFPKSSQVDIENPQMSSTLDKNFPDVVKIADELKNIVKSSSPKEDNNFQSEDSLIQNDSIQNYSREAWIGEVPLNSTFNDEDKMHKYKINRPPDLDISLDDHNETSGPPVLSSKTPVDYRCETPSAATILEGEQKKMALLLQRFGLTRFIFTFLTQEVDLDLFLTLNEQDLWEIGIQSKSDRIVLLSVIEECNRYHV